MAKSVKSAAAPVKRTECPISRAEFASAPETVLVTIAGQPLSAERKEFSTGSLGYFANGKVTLLINGKPVKAQVGLNVTIVGSKDLPK